MTEQDTLLPFREMYERDKGDNVCSVASSALNFINTTDKMLVMHELRPSVYRSRPDMMDTFSISLLSVAHSLICQYKYLTAACRRCLSNKKLENVTT